MNPQRKSYCTQGQLTRLLTGTSVLALLVEALPAIAHADDVSRSETFGSNGKNGKAYLIGSNDPSTPGINGGTIDINNTHASTKETTNTTSVKIGSTGGDGGHGDSAGFSDVDGSPGGKGGNVTLTQRGSLAAKGNQSDSASPTLPNGRTSRDPRWYQYGGNANLLVYSQGGDGGYANYSLGAGGDGGAVRLSLSDNVTTEGDRFAGVWARSLGGNAGMGGTIESYVSALGGGDGGNVATTIGNVLIGTDGLYAPAVIAESLGGHGGDRGSGFYAKPYTTVGGNGGRVSVSSYGRINTAQDYSTGILAQSVAGRGGDQGTSGGRPGAKGGNGGYVSVVNNGSVSTDGKYSFGTLFSVVMIILGAMVGLSLFLGALRHREQYYNLQGANAYLGVIVPLATLSLVLPTFANSGVPGSFASVHRLMLIVIALLLYGTFLLLQTGRNRGYFNSADETFVATRSVAESGASARQGHDIHPPRDPARSNESGHAGRHAALLVAYMIPVVFLVEEFAVPIDYVIETLHAPKALGGVVMAVLVATPEAIGAVEAALSNHLQRSINIFLGSVLSTIGLTVPFMLIVGFATGHVIVLGLHGADLILLVLALATSIITFASGRTNFMQGAVHLLLFAAFVFLLF